MELNNVNIVSVTTKKSGDKPYYLINIAERPGETWTYWHDSEPKTGPAKSITYTEKTKGDKVYRNISAIEYTDAGAGQSSSPAPETPSKTLTEIIAPEMTRLLLKWMEGQERANTPNTLAGMHRQMCDEWRKSPEKKESA